MVSPIKARFGMTATVGAVVAAALLVMERANVLRISNVAVADAGIRAALFGALLTACGLFITVYLAILAAVTTLDEERPIMKIMRRSGSYDELIHRLIGPVFSVLVVASLCIGCILLPSAPTGTHDAYRLGGLVVLPCITIGLAVGLFAQTASIALLLARVLMFKPRRPSTNDTVEASRARMSSPAKTEPDHDDGAAAAALSFSA